MKKIIFNASMPRSGSELFQAVISQNPEIYGSATSPLLEYQFAARNNFELPEVRSQDPETMKSAFLNMNMGMAQSYYEPITDKPIICDKNRGWSHYYEWVEQWNPKPKMICMVRDLRSVVASMERIFRKNRQNPQSIDDPANMQNMTVGQRVNHWLNTQPVGLGLQRTLNLFETGISENILFIRYEDFCKNPQREMDNVYEFIGEDSFKHDFKNIVKTVQEDDSHFGIFGNHSVKKSIQKPKQKDWSDVLNDEISDAIVKSAEWYFTEFNYKK